jgi:hypothetical protein
LISPGQIRCARFCEIFNWAGKVQNCPQITQITQISFKDKGDGESLMFLIYIEGVRQID